MTEHNIKKYKEDIIKMINELDYSPEEQLKNEENYMNYIKEMRRIKRIKRSGAKLAKRRHK
jgi:glycerol-3-phosphate cytidylyltransferase-like family protein